MTKATKSKAKNQRQLVIVTGLSGAGKSSVLHAFEDIGFQAIDNLPLSMIETLLDDSMTTGDTGPVAIGVDSRTLHFSPEQLGDIIKAVKKRQNISLHVLFMDASSDVLMKRFSETRRPHPLGSAKLLRGAILQERDMMAGVRPYIDGIIDTTSRSASETRRIIRRRFAGQVKPRLIVTFMSFG
ncbi:MAG: hypothetical protein MI743_00050, partial [Sneathiellales bacterium]|nr:hypothetical protein [Sneathiellales bacterium]